MKTNVILRVLGVLIGTIGADALCGVDYSNHCRALSEFLLTLSTL